MQKHRPTYFEKAALCLTAVIVVTGVVASNVDVIWFEEVFAAEDGFVENLTLLPLLVSATVGIWYLVKLSGQRSRLFSVTVSLAVLFCVFVAGEEISWGQRIFNIESGTFFEEHNAQKETNLHNLVVGGKKVNKIIFSQLLTAAAAFYLLVLPWLYRKKTSWSSGIDYAGIPIPRTYQVVSCILLFVGIALMPSEKNAEILEGGITMIFMLIFIFPQNKHVFRPDNGEKSHDLPLI